ncbi:hypothetical protein BHU72_04255 [Desulfuribacillus stibiiarsenatis]|uniref:Uncharacterized protein n=1 Tax=Desulfuribacillus stibiiarsenatis TaxID=1390249 RepID=A0A1E5L5H1_9FIRM|nr:hypothetical protein [Desulfuribacillus stibiiarsenatis]OEH85314.1 hypothetical protein BHU72_04255 [Desulfuribacillus stibiiarsenatis]
MARISRYSLLKNSRFRLHHAKELNQPQSVVKVDPIDSTRSMNNHSEHPSDHQLMFYDNYYESIKDLKEEFRKFYHDEKAVKQTLVRIHDDTEGHLIDHMQELISKFNTAYHSLQAFDTAAKTSQSHNIQHLLTSYKSVLEDFGISGVEQGRLTLDADTYIRKLSLTNEFGELTTDQHSTKNPTDAIFSPMKEIILPLYKALQNIRLPKYRSRNKYLEHENFSGDLKGLIIEQKT